MKNLLLLLLLLNGFLLCAQSEEYTIQLNDTTFEIALDTEYSLSINGEVITFKVTGKDTLVYEDDIYSFQYPKDFKVSKLKVDQGIEQVMLLTAEGSGILIQQYSTMNPSMLNELMLNEVTKESLSYGYEMKREDYTRSLKSGQSIDVDKAVLNYKGETNIYEIASIGTKDEGILIMTMIMDETLSEQGKRIINMMWDSLIYKPE